MAKHMTVPPEVVPKLSESSSTDVTLKEPTSVSELYERELNQVVKLKSITIKRTLTKPIIAVAHREGILFQCVGEMYEISLPLAGRADDMAPAKVIDVIEYQPVAENEYHPVEGILVLNAMMISALERAKPPLDGRVFTAVAGEIRADKRYRLVDVREVTFES